MSADNHGHGHANPGAEPPRSAGIAMSIYVFLAVALVIIFWQGSNVVSSSSYGRVTPSADSEKVPLPPAKF